MYPGGGPTMSTTSSLSTSWCARPSITAPRPSSGCPGCSDLADQHDVEGRTKRVRHLESNWHATPRQRQYDRMLFLQRHQRSGEPAPCIFPIGEYYVVFP